jgi:flagellum-specific peptidoglycan hydrolase FlgJ
VSQQTVLYHTAQQKAAATHIPATHEFLREMQPFAEDRQQMIDIFPRGNAPKQNN